MITLGNQHIMKPKRIYKPIVVEYSCHQYMKRRCYNVNCKSYPNYGGRGIIVCDRWLGEYGYANFLEDMGRKPTKNHSLDRIDSNGNYSPENCRWATVKEQSINHRRNWIVLISGEWVDGVQAAVLLGVKYSSLVNGMRGVQHIPKKCKDIIYKRRGEESFN